MKLLLASAPTLVMAKCIMVCVVMLIFMTSQKSKDDLWIFFRRQGLVQ